jgi:hypothetical protein
VAAQAAIDSAIAVFAAAGAAVNFSSDRLLKAKVMSSNSSSLSDVLHEYILLVGSILSNVKDYDVQFASESKLDWNNSKCFQKRNICNVKC